MNLRADRQLIAAGGQRTALCDDVARRAVPGNAHDIYLVFLDNDRFGGFALGVQGGYCQGVAAELEISGLYGQRKGSVV